MGVKLLVTALNSNFGLSSYIRLEGGLPVIYVPKGDIELVKSLVLHHMHPSTYYKLGV